MTKIQNSEPVLVIWYWNLRIVCNLVLGVWDFTNATTPLLQLSAVGRKSAKARSGDG